MTKIQYCKNCKHLETDGMFGIFCGVGGDNTKYDCSKYVKRSDRMTEKYVLEVDIDHETGEEHCTVLKTDGTTNMANWIEIVSAMYTHHSILEPLVDELNKIQNNYNNTEKYGITLWKENEQLKQSFINLIDKKIEEFKNGDYGDLPCNTIHMFLDLKEEL